MSLSPFVKNPVVKVEKSASISEVARVMRSENVGDVIVTEFEEDVEKPIGVLTDRDIVIELLADDMDINSVTAGDTMSYDLHLLHEDMGVAEALQFLRENGIRRAPVIDASGEMMGIISADDLLSLLATEIQTLSEVYLYNG